VAPVEAVAVGVVVAVAVVDAGNERS